VSPISEIERWGFVVLETISPQSEGGKAMKFWSIGLEWWILYGFLFIFILLVIDLERTLYQIYRALKELHSNVEFGFRDELEQLRYIKTNIGISSVD
jgi:hypothetical protein